MPNAISGLKRDESALGASDTTLSVVVITKNEEIDLPGFLRNFSTIADEIVIIDDGSNDRTEDIARAFDGPVRFVAAERAPDEGFCDQRNKGVAAARGDWVLQVDCDMRLTAGLAHEILSAIRTSDMVAYRFRLLQYFLGHECRYGGLQYWNNPWLCRRDVIHWTQKLHERANIDATESRIGQLQNKMVHLMDQDFSERMRKNYQYSHLEADRLVREGRKTTLRTLIYQPFWRAFRAYVLMKGFLDGKIGLIWALYQFTGTANAYFIAWDRASRTDRSEIDRNINQAIESGLQRKKGGADE